MDLHRLAHRNLQLAMHAAVAVLLAGMTALGVWSILATWHPLPFWDHWDTVSDYEHFLRDGFDWSRVIAQHNEHRIVFSNLINLADYQWFEGGGALQLAINSIVSCVLIALLVRFSGAHRRGLSGIPGFLFCTGMGLSVCQLVNLSWAFQTAWFLVALFATLAFRSHERVVPLGGRDMPRTDVRWLAASWALAAATTFSNANGMLAWVALLVLGRFLRHPRRTQIATAIAGAAFIALYFRGYWSPPQHPSIPRALRQPLALAEFMAIYASNPMQRVGVPAQYVLGAAVVLVALAHVLIFLCRKSALDRDRAFLASFVTFLLGTMAITAAGRLGFGGPETANASRYVTYGLLLMSSVMLLLAGRKPAGAPVPWLLPALTLLLVVSTWSGLTGAQFRDAVWQRRVRVDVELCDQFNACTVQDYLGVYPDARLARERMDFLRVHHLSLFAPWFAPRVPPAALAAIPGVASLPRCQGSFDALTRSTDGISIANGWMSLPSDRRALPDFVTLVRPDGHWLGGGGMVDEREDVQRSLHLWQPGPWRSYGFRAWTRTDGDSLVAVGFFRGGTERCVLAWKRSGS